MKVPVESICVFLSLTEESVTKSKGNLATIALCSRILHEDLQESKKRPSPISLIQLSKDSDVKQVSTVRR
jgi:hypothetical protein